MTDYKISTLDDFGNIPADRLETCLAELLPVFRGVSTARAHGALEQLTEECQGMYVTTQMLNAREDVTAAEAALTKLGVKL